MRRVLECRQQALKVSCNSVYGFCGASTGPLPCLALAATVTAVGRGLIAKAKGLIEAHYTVAAGRVAADATVVYGDTDSVMVDFHLPPPGPGQDSVREAARLGAEAAALVTAAAPAPIRLEFEKVYCPYLLFCKKRYAGLLFSAPGAPGRVDVKGVETVRRDSCEFVQEVYTRCLEILLTGPGRGTSAGAHGGSGPTLGDGGGGPGVRVGGACGANVGAAVTYVREQALALLDGRVPGSKLVLSTALVRRGCKSKTPHLEVVRRAEARGDPPYQIGDRVQYIKLAGVGGGSSIADQCEEPAYALDQALPIDFEWYLSNQLKQPFVKLFQVLIPAPEKELFGGLAAAVGRVVKQFRPRSDVMRRFFVPTTRCAGCDAPIKTKVQADYGLCQSCEPDRDDYIMSAEASVMEAQHAYRVAMAVCAACTSGYGEGFAEKCRNVGCEQLYRRDRAAADVSERQAQLQALIGSI